MTRRTAAQIDRANEAAMLLREGTNWATVVDSLGFYDQAHLAHSVRRFLGRTVGEVVAGDLAAMSFLYKTGPGAAS